MSVLMDFIIIEKIAQNVVSYANHANQAKHVWSVKLILLGIRISVDALPTLQIIIMNASNVAKIA